MIKTLSNLFKQYGSFNTFAKPTKVDTDNRLICYYIFDLGNIDKI